MLFDDLFEDLPDEAKSSKTQSSLPVKSEVKAISVSALVRQMKQTLQTQVGECWVEGEVSNVRRPKSGHVYFSLKDSNAQISCTAFRIQALRLGKLLEDGEQIKLFGEVTIYEAQGQAQIIVKKAEKVGEGDLQKQLEALKAKLQAEGLFEQDHKQALPKFPLHIGLITSDSGAVIEDMEHVLSRRAPWVRRSIYPVKVQGLGAAEEIAQAIEQINEHVEQGKLDIQLLIVGRGGGSIEDLWCFNEEVVARAIYASKLPIISAVGHEIDFTVADLVADLRAPTPSAAAELAVPDKQELQGNINYFRQRMSLYIDRQHATAKREFDIARQFLKSLSVDYALREYQWRADDLSARLESSVNTDLELRKQQLTLLKQSLKSAHPQVGLTRNQEDLVKLRAQLNQAMQHQLERKQAQFKSQKELFEMYSIDSTLKRGFSITTNQAKQVVSDISQVKLGDTLVTQLAHGKLEVEIKHKEP